MKKLSLSYYVLIPSMVMIFGLTGCKKKIADITIDKVTQELSESVKKYDEVYGFHEGLSKVCKNDKYGFIDKLGVEIIPCRYENASDFQYGVSIVKLDGKVGVIDVEEDQIVPFVYDEIRTFNEDSLASASVNGKVGVINVKGETVIPFEYDEIGRFNEGFAYVIINDKYGFINKTGDLIIPCIYDDLYNGCGFSEGLVGVKKNGEWGYLYTNGIVAIPFKQGLSGAPFSSGLSTITKYNGERFVGAFINTNGDLVCDYTAKFDFYSFRDGYCVVQDEIGYQGLINSRLEFTIPCQYKFIANGFDDEYVVIRDNLKYGFARKSTGEIVVPCMYEIDIEGWTFRDGLAPVKKNGKYGFINEDNDVIIPFNYDEADGFSEGFAVVNKYGKYGFVDRYGNDTFY